MARTVDDHMALNYRSVVAEETDFDGTRYYVAFYEELPGLEGAGGTEEEAVADLEKAKEIWFKKMIEEDLYFPLPRNFDR